MLNKIKYNNLMSLHPKNFKIYYFYKNMFIILEIYNFKFCYGSRDVLVSPANSCNLYIGSWKS